MDLYGPYRIQEDCRAEGCAEKIWRLYGSTQRFCALHARVRALLDATTRLNYLLEAAATSRLDAVIVSTDDLRCLLRGAKTTFDFEAVKDK